MDTWNNACCYAALLAVLRMAEARLTCRPEDTLLQGQSARWRSDTSHLCAGMLNGLVQDSPFGPIWNYQSAAPFHWENYISYTQWADYCQNLGPILNLADVTGLDPAGMHPEFVTITRNTLHFLLDRKPEGPRRYEYARLFGYGQAFITEAALLLDEMQSATRLIRSMAQYISSPHVNRWIVPEGVTVHSNGKYWYRDTRIGNEIQIASTVRCMRLLAGVDDSGRELCLLTRLPHGWTGISVAHHPVAIPGGRDWLAFNYDRETDGAYTFSGFQSENGLARRAAIRFGPFHLDADPRYISILFNNETLTVDPERDFVRSGDASWLWVRPAELGPADWIRVAYRPG